MEMTEATPFIREIEKRLDVLLGEDGEKPGPSRDSGLSLLEAGGDPVDAEMHAGTAGLAVEGEKNHDNDASTDSGEGSPFLREIEERLDAACRENAVSGGESERHEESEEDGGERFQRLFGEAASSGSILYSPLRNLKTVVLSIEWEIDALTLARFDEEINRLDREYAEDRDILAYLRILRFLGRYLQVKGAGADSGSILLLMSLYDSLERIVLARGMAGNEKRDLLLEDIGKYRGWAGKADLKAGHEEPQDKAAGVPAAEKDPAPEMTAREALTCVMEEIRKLREEVSALRDELKTLKSGRAAVNDSAPHH